MDHLGDRRVSGHCSYAVVTDYFSFDSFIIGVLLIRFKYLYFAPPIAFLHKAKTIPCEVLAEML